ncbi:MAG: response regulator [Candidatus Bathyarchaeota archaeon]|nr:response regulator [Candidatus Bathyarchaeota archaeon]
MIKILHVDDEQHYLELTKEIIMAYDKDMEIETSTSPYRVLENIHDMEPDLILSDYKMPEMNGIEFTRRLRELSEIPVIMYTGNSEEEVAEKAFQAGVDDYVTKAHDAAHYLVLLKRIKNCVDKHRIQLELTRKTDEEAQIKNQEMPQTQNTNK